MAAKPNANARRPERNQNERRDQGQDRRRETGRRENNNGGQGQELARQMSDQVFRGARDRSAESLQLVSAASGTLLNGLQQLTREMLNWNQEAMSHWALRDFNRQAELARSSMEMTFEHTRRIGEILIQLSEDAERSQRGSEFDDEDMDEEEGGENERNQRQQEPQGQHGQQGG